MKKRNPYKGRDAFSRKAREEGYEARSVFKLDEIQKRFRLLEPGQRVVDLGCFPGSWSRFAIERIGPGGRLVGVDLQVPTLSGGTFLARSVYDVQPAEILELLGGRADAVLSDMAPFTCGDRFSDHARQIDLARRALAVAIDVLVPGGSFVSKVFEGEDAAAFVREVRERFAEVKRVRPEAVRKTSREWFLVARGFR